MTSQIDLDAQLIAADPQQMGLDENKNKTAITFARRLTRLIADLKDWQLEIERSATKAQRKGLNPEVMGSWEVFERIQEILNGGSYGDPANSI